MIRIKRNLVIIAISIVLSLLLAGTASAALTCYVDAQGANDEPGQKDLTQFCIDNAGLPDTIFVSWDWDEIYWTGANTGDACSLFDNDEDGNVNYALCVTVGNIKGVRDLPAVELDTRLYSCGDDSSDRCTQPVGLINHEEFLDSSCDVFQSNTDPFNSSVDNGPGDVYPDDTTDQCQVFLHEVGGLSSVLIDACSYPALGQYY